MDNLEVDSIGVHKAHWPEREFEEGEVKDAIFDLAGDKAPGLNRFQIAFFERFWEDIKEEMMAFMSSFHYRGRLSKHIRASFIVLISRKSGEESIRDIHPISLIGSIYKILAKVLASRIQRVLPHIISEAQGAFIHG